MSNKDIYAMPRLITDIGECYFYHTMDIPGYGIVEGEWDLRQGAHKYLGGVNFKGKRVLEIGTASGFLCFYMENQGAEVVAYDLSENQSWDLVSSSQWCNYAQFYKAHIKKINNAFWLNHRLYKSSAKMVYGTVYAIPEQIGMVDISTFGSILRHLRDPFLALQNVLKFTKETVIVTESFPLGRYSPLKIFSKFIGPSMQFLPKSSTCTRKDSWWRLPPEVIIRFIEILGFEKVKVKYHTQKYRGHRRTLYTVVGHRTGDI